MSKDQDGSLEAIAFNPEFKVNSPNFNKSTNPVLLIPCSLFQNNIMDEEEQEEEGGKGREEGGEKKKDKGGGGAKWEEGGGNKQKGGGVMKEEKGRIRKNDGRRISGGREDAGSIAKIVVTKVVEETRKGSGQKGGGEREKIGGVGSAILKGEHSLLSQEGGGDSSILGILKQSSEAKFSSPLRRREILPKTEVYVADQIIKLSPNSNAISLAKQNSGKSGILKPKPLIPQKHLSFFAAKPGTIMEISEIKSALIKKKKEGKREEEMKEGGKEEDDGWKVERGWNLEGNKKQEATAGRKEDKEGKKEEGGGRKMEGGGKKEEGVGIMEEGGMRKEEGVGRKEEGVASRKDDIPVMKAKLFNKNEHSKSTQLKPPSNSKVLFTPQARQSIKININIKTLDSARENFRVFKVRLSKMGGEVGKERISEEMKKEINELVSEFDAKQYSLNEGDRMLLEKLRGMGEEGVRGGRSCSFNLGRGEEGKENSRKISARLD